MEKLLKNSLSVSVALAVMMTATVSSANTQKDDEDDSVFGWGPWGTVETAAGPGNPAIPLVISFADSRNMTDSSNFVAGISGPSADGSVYREYMAWYSKNGHEDGRKFERANFTSLEAGVDGPEGRATFDFDVATEAGDQTYSPEMLLVGGSGLKGASYSAEESKFGRKYGYKNRWQNKYTDSEDFKYSSVFNELNEDRKYTEGDVAYINGRWMDKETVTYYYRNRARYSNSTFNDIGFFVTGNTSTLASINQLIAGNVQANYSGSFLTTQRYAGRVNLSVDFGNNSWSGNFVTPTSSRDETIAFSVNNGSINGVDLAGVVDHENDYNKGFFNYQETVTGQVDASFFGDKAQHVNGITDVGSSTVKTGRLTGHNYGTTSDSYVGVFTTEQQVNVPD